MGMATTARQKQTGIGPVPKRPFGRSGEQVSIIGLGGATLSDAKTETDGVRIVHEAIDAGVNFMDNAWEYHNGNSEELMGRALKGRRDKVFLMTKVCTHGRDANVAMKQLEDSLRRLKTDRLDLWQIHEVIYENDPELHFAKGGVVEALEEAKRQGKVRYVGFTGHKDPSIHLSMLAYDYAFDSCQLPLNVFDASFRSFETRVLPELNKRGIAPIAMKSLGGNADAVKKGVISAAEAIRYVLSLPISVLVSGIDSIKVLRENLKTACDFQPMSPDEMNALRQRVGPMAADGRFELFKTSKYYDGPPGRHQHGFPGLEELAS